MKAAIRGFISRAAGLFGRRERDLGLSDELNGHLDAHIDDNIRAGMTPAEGRRQALIALGGLSQTTEAYRERRTFPFVETTMQDIRYALRLLWKSPGYTLAAVAALAIGIGANTAVFSIVNGVLLKALPYRDPQQLVLLYEQLPNAPVKFGFSPPDFQIVRELAQSYSGFAGYLTRSYELSGSVAPQRLNGARVSPAVFSVLGVAPALGRALTEDDDRQNARVTVLSHGLWTRAFGRDPALVGKTVALDGRTYAVVGIMPERFVFPPRGGGLGGGQFNGEPADVFVPMSFLPFERQAFGMMYNNTVVARLKPGVSIERARAELSGLVAPLLDRYPPPIRQSVARLAIPIAPMYDETVGDSRRLIVVLMAAVGLVLLIGCADVASLILTRSAARQRELAIRAALGATGARIVRQLLTEAFVLAATGSVVGLMLAYGLMRGLLVLAGDKLPRSESIAFDTRIVLFALALAIVTPLVFGVVPAFRAARGMDGDALKEGGRSLTSGRRKAWLLGSLVVGQFALALMLSVGAGLLVRSFARLLQTNAGFRSEHSVRATITLPIGRYAPPKVRPFYQQSIDALRAIPGAAAVGAGDLPLGVRERRSFSADAAAREIPETSRLIAVIWTSGAYFDALGIPIKRGRVFTDSDGPAAQQVAIVNEQFVRLNWPGADPIGRKIRWGLNIPENQSPWKTIVGVVADVKQAALDTPTIAQVYVPVAQDDTSANRVVNLIVRSARDSVSVAADVRGAVQRLDGSLPVTVQTLDDLVSDSVKPQRFSMTVMTAFAGLALLLAALGIYGVLANAVAQQTQEIGVRVALGATTADVVWMVLRRALTLMGAGLVIGVAGALAVTRTMASLLFEVRPTDAVSFGGAVACLAAIALIASLVPAWRATRVDPIVALRAE
jgi:putative ABC transport system permease protein